MQRLGGGCRFLLIDWPALPLAFPNLTIHPTPRGTHGTHGTIRSQHEQGAGHMADGYSRVSPTRRHGVCTAQNGPGITNFVTSVAAAYWAHSPVVCITPEAGSTTKGHGGFQVRVTRNTAVPWFPGVSGKGSG